MYSPSEHSGADHEAGTGGDEQNAVRLVQPSLFLGGRKSDEERRRVHMLGSLDSDDPLAANSHVGRQPFEEGRRQGIGDDEVDVGGSRSRDRQAVTWPSLPAHAAARDPKSGSCSTRSRLRRRSNPTRQRKRLPSSEAVSHRKPARPRRPVLPVADDRRAAGREREAGAMPWPGSASLATTRAWSIVPDCRNPSATCSAVSTPQPPLAMSKEKVPWTSAWGSSGLMPTSSWIRAASAGSPRFRLVVEADVQEEVDVADGQAGALDGGPARLVGHLPRARADVPPQGHDGGGIKRRCHRDSPTHRRR